MKWYDYLRSIVTSDAIPSDAALADTGADNGAKPTGPCSDLVVVAAIRSAAAAARICPDWKDSGVDEMLLHALQIAEQGDCRGAKKSAIGVLGFLQGRESALNRMVQDNLPWDTSGNNSTEGPAVGPEMFHSASDEKNDPHRRMEREAAAAAAIRDIAAADAEAALELAKPSTGTETRSHSSHDLRKSASDPDRPPPQKKLRSSSCQPAAPWRSLSDPAGIRDSVLLPLPDQRSSVRAKGTAPAQGQQNQPQQEQGTQPQPKQEAKPKPQPQPRQEQEQEVKQQPQPKQEQEAKSLHEPQPPSPQQHEKQQHQQSLPAKTKALQSMDSMIQAAGTRPRTGPSIVDPGAGNYPFNGSLGSIASDEKFPGHNCVEDALGDGIVFRKAKLGDVDRVSGSYWAGKVKHKLGTSVVELFFLSVILPSPVIQHMPLTLYVTDLVQRSSLSLDKAHSVVRCRLDFVTNRQMRKLRTLADLRLAAVSTLQHSALTLVPFIDAIGGLRIIGFVKVEPA